MSLNSKIDTLKKIYVTKVIGVKNNKVIVNSNLKCLYYININEFNEEELKNLNDKEILVYISSLDPIKNKDRIASYKRAKQEILWNKVVEIRKNNSDVQGKVVNSTKGGYSIFLDIGINAFLPTSHISEEAYEENVVGKNLDFKIIVTNKLHRNVIISRKALVIENLENKNKDKIEILSNGAVIFGIIKGINNYGLFVNLGFGYSSIIQSNECTWGHDVDLFDFYYVGQKIEALVTEVNHENKKIGLSINKISKNPFKEIKKGDKLNAKTLRVIKEFTDKEHEKFSIIYKTVPNSLICKVNFEDSRYDEYEILKAIEDQNEVEITTKFADPENKLIYGITKRKKDDIWKSFIESYGNSNDEVNFIVKRKSRFSLFLANEDYETILPINEISFYNTSQIFKDIQIRDEIKCKILYLDYENQRSFISCRYSITEDMKEKFFAIVNKGFVSCKLLYKLNNRKFVASIDNLFENIIDIERMSEDTWYKIQKNNIEFQMNIDSYDELNYTLSVYEGKKEKTNISEDIIDIKNAKLSELIDNFNIIFEEIESNNKE